jgi:hypothetical protein
MNEIEKHCQECKKSFDLIVSRNTIPLVSF